MKHEVPIQRGDDGMDEACRLKDYSQYNNIDVSYISIKLVWADTA